MSKPGLHLINVSSLSFIKKKIIIFLQLQIFWIFLHNWIRRFLLTSDTVRVFLYFMSVDSMRIESLNFYYKIFWEHVDWNYPQFHTEFVGIKILSPLSSISFLLPIFPVSFHIFPSILFFTSLKIVDLSIANIFANLHCFLTELYKSI